MREYKIYLANTLIGITFLEKADPPMGVAFGEIKPLIEGFGYAFIKKYCEKYQIPLAFIDNEAQVISTTTITDLHVFNSEGIEIIGLGNQIEGMDSDVFHVTIEGVGYPFFEEEFPQHCERYRNQFL